MSSGASVPFLDLVSPHLELREELTGVFEKVLDTAGFIGGPYVQGFEEDFARYCGTPYCVGVGNGTKALRMALFACGVRPGEIVLTTPNTFIATTEAISQVNAIPMFVDIDEATCNLDPGRLRAFVENECRLESPGKLIHRKSGARVGATIPVHLYGQTADMDPILEIAAENGLIVVEDACQAHGAEYFSRHANRWLRAGSMGTAAAFSFYPGKNLGACGEAGAVTTGDESVATRIRMMRDHGQSRKYIHEIEGSNGRLDALQAGFLQIKLRNLPKWTELRQQAADRYRRIFGDTGPGIILPHQAESNRHVYHLYVVRVAQRDLLIRELGKAGIGTGIHYPIPLHRQTAYRHLGYPDGSFPVAERIAKEIVSLPMFPQLEECQQRHVVENVMAFISASEACVL